MKCWFRDSAHWARSEVQKILKGQAKVEIISPNPVVFYSSPLLPLTIQRKIDAVDITISMSVIYFSLNTQGLD